MTGTATFLSFKSAIAWAPALDCDCGHTCQCSSEARAEPLAMAERKPVFSGITGTLKGLMIFLPFCMIALEVDALVCLEVGILTSFIRALITSHSVRPLRHK